MLKRKKNLYISAILIATVALVFLATAIQRVDLRQGTIFYSESQEQSGESRSFYPIELPKIEPVIPLTLMGILLLVNLLILIRLIWYLPMTWRHILRNLLVVLIWSAFLYYSFTKGNTETALEGEITPLPGLQGTAIPAVELPAMQQAPLPEIESSAPDWVTFIIGFTLIAVLLTAGYLIYKRLFSSPAEEGEMGQLVSEAQTTLEDIRAGANLRNAILRCYYEMSLILSEEKGIKRQEWMTPREFENRLLATGLPEKPVSTLTRLFEFVRYGANDPDKEQEAQAVACLTAIARSSDKKP